MKKYQLYATMGAGFESVVNKELQGMGYKTRVENGRVFFKGSQAILLRLIYGLGLLIESRFYSRNLKQQILILYLMKSMIMTGPNYYQLMQNFLYKDEQSNLNCTQNQTFNQSLKKQLLIK